MMKKRGVDWLNSRTKRIADIIFWVLALPVLLPTTLLLMAMIVVFDRATPMLRQMRVGKNGVPFSLYKLNTNGRERGSDVGLGANDPRATRLGRLLRLTILDENPQLLINVIRGDMSVVGPRPLLQADVDLMKRTLPTHDYKEWYTAYTAVRHGWTGKFGQASRMFAPQSQEYLEARKLHDVTYLRTANPWMDAGIILVHFKLFYIDLRYRQKMKRLQYRRIKN